jgi:mRNA interferase RelE/StbE
MEHSNRLACRKYTESNATEGCTDYCVNDVWHGHLGRVYSRPGSPCYASFAQNRGLFDHLDLTLARKPASWFELLEANPSHHPNIKKLLGPLKGLHQFRDGDYRIIYQIDNTKKIVFVVRIAHRKEAYD